MRDEHTQLPLFVTEKRCTRCHAMCAPTAFAKGSKWCRPCKSAYDRIYRQRNGGKRKAQNKRHYEENKDRYRELNRAWKVKNRGRIRELNRGYYQRNREEILERGRVWRQANPDNVRANVRRWRAKHPRIGIVYWHNRRARLCGATVGEVDFDRILERSGGICYLCRLPIETNLAFDHVVPLSRGGAHSEENIRPTHRSCNSRKSWKLLDEMGLPGQPQILPDGPTGVELLDFVVENDHREGGVGV